MKARDFIYFTQGYFEIAEASNTPSTLSLDQAKILKDNIQKIDKSFNPDFIEQQCLNTVSFIGGVLAILDMQASPTSEKLDNISKIIQTKLNETFVHSVDPSYEGNQKDFQDIHDGEKKNSDGPKPNGLEALC